MSQNTIKYVIEVETDYGWVMEHSSPFHERKRAVQYYEDLVEGFPERKFRLNCHYTMEILIRTNGEWPEEIEP